MSLGGQNISAKIRLLPASPRAEESIFDPTSMITAIPGVQIPIITGEDPHIASIPANLLAPNLPGHPSKPNVQFMASEAIGPCVVIYIYSVPTTEEAIFLSIPSALQAGGVTLSADSPPVWVDMLIVPLATKQLPAPRHKLLLLLHESCNEVTYYALLRTSPNARLAHKITPLAGSCVILWVRALRTFRRRHTLVTLWN